MFTLIRQELYKLIKKTSTWICLLLVLIINIGLSIVSHAMPEHFLPKELFVADYGANTFISLILISTTASIVASEFEYGTIRNIIFQSYSRQRILISKWITILIYSVSMYIFFAIFTFLDKLVLFPNKFSLTDKVQGGRLWQYWLQTNWADLLTTWLILSVVFLIAALLKKGSTAIIVGIVGYFAVALIGPFMNFVVSKWHFMKWNPLNFMNYTDQIANHTVSHTTLLSLNKMVLGNIVYIIIFLAIGLLIFSNKEV